jgi:hypothetical protein
MKVIAADIPLCTKTIMAKALIIMTIAMDETILHIISMINTMPGAGTMMIQSINTTEGTAITTTTKTKPVVTVHNH